MFGTAIQGNVLKNFSTHSDGLMGLVWSAPLVDTYRRCLMHRVLQVLERWLPCRWLYWRIVDAALSLAQVTVCFLFVGVFAVSAWVFGPFRFDEWCPCSESRAFMLRRV